METHNVSRHCTSLPSSPILCGVYINRYPSDYGKDSLGLKIIYIDYYYSILKNNICTYESFEFFACSFFVYIQSLVLFYIALLQLAHEILLHTNTIPLLMNFYV